jgi:hypothetical protein
MFAGACQVRAQSQRETIRNMDMVAIGRVVLQPRDTRKGRPDFGIEVVSFLIAPGREVVVFQS